MTQEPWCSSTLQEGDYKIKDFEFNSGEVLPELNLHYRTLGTPQTSPENGQTTNAILVMHGTGGSGTQFLVPQFANELFNPGQPLDTSRYFIILRDGIGHGGSSRPSTSGLRAGFPKYGYNDMIRADHELLTLHLGVNHLRLVMGTSMGGMHTYLWGETYPEFMDALMPLASLPIQISGRNRMFRKMVIDGITSDPAYNSGDYTTQPRQGLTTALYVLTFMSSIPLQWQKVAPDRDSADEYLEKRMTASLESTDANDMLFYFDASRDYDPQSRLKEIRRPLVAVNSADDQVNPPELGILEKEIKENVEGGRAVVLPITEETQGHGSHTHAKLWKEYLIELLEKTEGVV